MVRKEQPLSKTKEIIVDFHITDSLTWSLNTEHILKKAQQRLYFLRGLKKFGLSTKGLVNFYRCTIESVLTGCIKVVRHHDRPGLQEVAEGR